jgi:hypothetical protein
MFKSRVMGVGTPVARLNDGTEKTFYPAGKQYQFQRTPMQAKWVDGVPIMVDGPPEGPVTMYDLQVTVKDYVFGSLQVKYTTWGRGLYPGFDPTPNYKTVSEVEFTAMFPEWPSVKAGSLQIPKGEENRTPDWVARGREMALESERQIKDAEKWRSNTPIATITALRQEGVPGVVDVYKVFGYNKELGLVWLTEGENSKATDSQLVPEFKMAAKFPEWVAAKASLGKSSAGGSAALPLLLGAAYLLLA